MLAVVLTRFGGVDALEVQEVTDPVAGPGEVVVEVAAAAVNNTDIWTRQGAYGAEQPAGWLGPIDFPRVPGADVCGHVVAVGTGVDPGWRGRRVLLDPVVEYSAGPEPLVAAVLGSEVDGGYAERVVVRADRVHDVSASPLTDQQLSCLPIAYGTATGMLERAGIGADETVLVTGASGGVGLALVDLAVQRGARVLALSSADKADDVLAAGAVAVIDRGVDDVAGRLADLAPSGVDAVADVVAGPLLRQLLPHVRPGGRWVVAGAVAGPVVEVDLRPLYLRSIRLIGSTMHTPAQLEVLVAAANRGHVAPRIAATHPLDAVREAHEQFERREHVGKIVLVP